MTCDHLHLGDSCLTICRPSALFTRTVMACPTCARRRRFVVGPHQAYYSPIWTCCACGDSWSEEGRMPRPFARGWRTREVARARRLWAGAVSKDEARARFLEEIS